MPRRSNRVIFLILTLTALSLFMGCTQPEDVISEVTSTRITLVPERLPTLPGGMVYELWVTDVDGGNVSLGKFSYDQVNRVFLESDGATVRADGAKFTFDDDLLKTYVYYDASNRPHTDFWYSQVWVSVENTPDDNGAEPGPSMLSDRVTVPSEDLIELRFQNKDTTLGDAIVRYNLESVSDANRFTSSVGQGLWFSAYQEATKPLPDTLHYAVSLIPDTVELEIEIIYNDDGDSIGYTVLDLDLWNQLNTKGPRSIISQYAETTDVLFGPDTIYLSTTPWRHIGYRVDFEEDIDTFPPYVLYSPRFQYVASDTVPRTITLDIFSQDEYNLPDYSPWGWHYKGWVVTSTGKTTGGQSLTSVIDARFTPPAWPYNSPTNKLIPGDDGALLSTGIFNKVDTADLQNPFILNRNLVPDYPGEDFLNTDSLFDRYGVAEAFDLLPDGSVGAGTAFITIEPNNFNANTNFPLIAFGQALPTAKSAVSGTNVSVTMRNWTPTLTTDLRGFPLIRVEIERF